MSEIRIADDSPLTSAGKGDSNEVFPPDAALTMQEQLVNAKGGAKLYFIKGANTALAAQHMLISAFPGAQGCLSVVPESASIANRVFASFLAGLGPLHSDSLPPTDPLDEALQRLADIMHDPDIATREPSSPMSFSCVPPVVAYRRLEIYARAAPGHRCAFSPLDTNGRPKRRCVSSHPISHPHPIPKRPMCFFLQIFRTRTGAVVRGGPERDLILRCGSEFGYRVSFVGLIVVSDRAIGGRKDEEIRDA